ncbi:MAG: hypothetical protein KatS3mg077_3366 [Candidatus Binatia bacterium]|nr:MAG: hypothetical protein KatS3mg077_3366 [Candidatus Binatia bacterium]
MRKSSSSHRGQGTQRGPRSLEHLLKVLGQGEVRRVYAFIGDQYLTDRAAKAVIDALVPPGERAWNLERYDARSANWNSVLHSIRTPAFGAARKVIWVHNVEVVSRRENRDESLEHVLQQWASGHTVEAATNLAAILRKAGWDPPESHTMGDSLPAKYRQKELFGKELDKAEADTVLQILEFLRHHKEELQTSPSDPLEPVVAYLEEAPSLKLTLILTGERLDQSSQLWKKIQQIGGGIVLELERDRSGALSRESAHFVIQEVLRDHHKTIEPQALELLIQRAGVDTTRLATEVEKLCLAVGEKTQIRAGDVSLYSTDLAESWVFDFTTALATRDAAQVLHKLQDLLDQGEHPLRLIAMIAKELRNLLFVSEYTELNLRTFLSAKQRSSSEGEEVTPVRRLQPSSSNLRAGGGNRTGRAELPNTSLPRAFSDFQYFSSTILTKIPDEELALLGKVHPYAVFKRFQHALLWRSQDLRKALVSLSALEQRLKAASMSEGQILLEGFILRWCTKQTSGRNV